MRGAFIALALCVSLSTHADVEACPMDEGAITLHPGSLASVTLLPSQPSLYFIQYYDVKLEIESNGKSVPFELVSIGDRLMRVDIDVDSGPLVIRTIASRTFTYEYRVVEGLEVNHDASVQSIWTSYYNDRMEVSLFTDAALVRAEWLDGDAGPWQRAEWMQPGVASVYIDWMHGPFRITGLFADRSHAVLWDPAGALEQIATGAIASIQTWLAPPPAHARPVARSPRWPLAALMGLACGITALVLRRRRIAKEDTHSA